MSSANAAAKKRRAPASIEPPVQSRPSALPTPGQNLNINTGLTLPQVIALIDKRLVNLESFMTESKKSNTQVIPQQQQQQQQQQQINPSSQQVDDFNERFDALADEIANMKNIVLSLQSYTMDVNKVLLEERTGILDSQSSNSNSQVFELTDNSESLDEIKNIIQNSNT